MVTAKRYLKSKNCGGWRSRENKVSRLWNEIIIMVYIENTQKWEEGEYNRRLEPSYSITLSEQFSP